MPTYHVLRTRQRRRRRRNRRTPNQLKRELGEVLHQHHPGIDNLEIMNVEDDHFTYRKCRDCPGFQVPYSINKHGTLLIDFTEEQPLQDNLQVNTGRNAMETGTLLPISIQSKEREEQDSEAGKQKKLDAWERHGGLMPTSVYGELRQKDDSDNDDEPGGDTGSLLPTGMNS